MLYMLCCKIKFVRPYIISISFSLIFERSYHFISSGEIPCPKSLRNLACRKSRGLTSWHFEQIKPIFDIHSMKNDNFKQESSGNTHGTLHHSHNLFTTAQKKCGKITAWKTICNFFGKEKSGRYQLLVLTMRPPKS